ncbi:thiosulfate sulfurtransferase 18-like [Phoenix dactylifera]|uniref:Thiosulfate sulfurtransferase 18-like n=1 Tax=Phoenix dactylifera TaxID=42345 RepID=A0A8B7MT15_PHODC|nr:thiosulfate sulfurtransferase 18-like [Phoenix dactylifera]XP_017696745.1 thiosulfate sulfurtransferase 18-like [Phoenix dactylifera]
MASHWALKWFCSCNVIALFLLFLWPPLSGSSEAIATVDVHAAKRLVYSGHRYLDVRTVEEFNKGHLENAINVPYLFFTPQGKEKNLKFVEQVSLVCDKDDHIVVGCLSGVRSLQAAVDLLDAGFKHVQNMGGGYAAWVENGFAVKKPREEL